ncbi:hypothetical protein [Actinomyces wuliandei]|uniref:hypothetical protein n=1 Tax=Actinomyces wuliandei TaxID=2057743 RepID=UPI000FD95507|nr:hypothetical protein [Actinomyces wuliandei]
MSSQLEIDYAAASQVARSFDNAQDSLEANAATMPSSVNGGEGTGYIAYALTLFAEAAGTFGQAAAHGASSTRTGVDLVSGVDEDVAADLRALAQEVSGD